MAGSLLIRRLIHREDEDNLNVHFWTAITAEAIRLAGDAQGAIDQIMASDNPDMVAQYTGMTVEEIQHWDWIIDNSGVAFTRQMFEDVMMIGEVWVYTEAEVISRLGLPQP